MKPPTALGQEPPEAGERSVVEQYIPYLSVRFATRTHVGRIHSSTGKTEKCCEALNIETLCVLPKVCTYSITGFRISWHRIPESNAARMRMRDRNNVTLNEQSGFILVQSSRTAAVYKYRDDPSEYSTCLPSTTLRGYLMLHRSP